MEDTQWNDEFYNGADQPMEETSPWPDLHINSILTQDSIIPSDEGGALLHEINFSNLENWNHQSFLEPQEIDLGAQNPLEDNSSWQLDLELEIHSNLPQGARIIPDEVDALLPQINLGNLEEWNQESSPEPQGINLVERNQVGEDLVVGGEKPKRKVGRPVKTEKREVTVLPTGKVGKESLEEARYRRMRDLNNIASQKCRLKKKDKARKEAEELQEISRKNEFLKKDLEEKGRLIKKLRDCIRENGISIPEWH